MIAERPHIVLDNLFYGYKWVCVSLVTDGQMREPCQMDMKIGTREWGDDVRDSVPSLP